MSVTIFVLQECGFFFTLSKQICNLSEKLLFSFSSREMLIFMVDCFFARICKFCSFLIQYVIIHFELLTFSTMQTSNILLCLNTLGTKKIFAKIIHFTLYNEKVFRDIHYQMDLIYSLI